MSYLDNILKSIGYWSGKTGAAINQIGTSLGNPLPEYNISENLQRIGGMLNPVTTANAQGISGSNYPGAPNAWGQSLIRDGSVLGTNIANNSGGTYGDTGGGDFGQSDADAERQRQLDIIRQRLDAFNSRAAYERGAAQKRFEDLKTSATSRFSTLRDKLAGTVATALENLGQERTSTQNLYGRAAGTARAALESALRGNRMQARAQNRLNSSFYDDTQSGTRSQFGRSIADTAAEEAGKLAGIGTRETETKNFGETERQNLDREEADLINEAQSKLNDELNSAEQLARSGLVDYAQAEDAVINNYNSRLQAIRNYIDNRNLRLLEIDATYGNKIGSFQAIDPTLLNILANTKSYDATQNLADTYSSPFAVGSTGGGASPLSYYQQSQTRTPYERIQEILGNLF